MGTVHSMNESRRSLEPQSELWARLRQVREAIKRLEELEDEILQRLESEKAPGVSRGL
jgi:hypothetical protein